MKVGAVVLSRYNSSRLPGKALKVIEGKPVLEYIIERLLTVLTLNQIIVATSNQPSDDKIAGFCKEINVNCYRGSLENVAERFYLAGKQLNCEYAIRINGDNIFVDSTLLKDMLIVTASDKYRFISNVKMRTYPKGMSIEIVELKHYGELLDAISTDDKHREHVTQYLYENELEEYHFIYNVLSPELSGVQLALDTPEDFERCKKIISKFTEPHTSYGMMDIYKSWNEE